VEAANKDEDLHLEWPSNPEISFKDLSARYKPELPLVIKNISFSVKRYSKVGIVGRTGAGKSSIIQAIFRIIEP
jgi:ATP-binding cassette, subfamily C (CFTR/MRP), member 1